MDAGWDGSCGPRPSSASVQVRELSWQGLHNPCPQSKGPGGRRGSRGEQLVEKHLSPARLRALAGEDDLQLVRVLEMCVDTRESSLGNFGVHLPNLNQLKLNGSRLGSLRVRAEMVPGPRCLRAAGDPREDSVRGPAHRSREPPGWSSDRQNRSLQSILVNVRCSRPWRTKLQWVWWLLSWVLLGLGENSPPEWTQPVSR